MSLQDGGRGDGRICPPLLQALRLEETPDCRGGLSFIITKLEHPSRLTHPLASDSLCLLFPEWKNNSFVSNGNAK